MSRNTGATCTGLDAVLMLGQMQRQVSLSCALVSLLVSTVCLDCYDPHRCLFECIQQLVSDSQIKLSCGSMVGLETPLCLRGFSVLYHFGANFDVTCGS